MFAFSELVLEIIFQIRAMLKDIFSVGRLCNMFVELKLCVSEFLFWMKAWVAVILSRSKTGGEYKWRIEFQERKRVFRCLNTQR